MVLAVGLGQHPLGIFVFNIHLLAHLRRRQLAAQVFSCHTHTNTQPQHV